MLPRFFRRAARIGSLGARVLRRGQRGADVARLQRYLLERDYDLGPVDGYFGFLTEDALRQFQKDHALRVDGIAGPEVFQVVLSPRGVPRRRVRKTITEPHMVARVAQALRVPLGYFVRVNRLRTSQRLEPGQTVSVYPLWVFLEMTDASRGILARRALDRHASRLTGLIDHPTEATSQAWPPGTSGWWEWPFDVLQWPLKGRIRYRSAQPVKEQLELIARAAATKAVRGFHVSRADVVWGQGAAWARRLARFSDYVWQHKLTLLVTLPLPNLRSLWRRAFNDLSLAEWVPLAQAVIVPVPDLGDSLSFNEWLGRLRTLRQHLPLWKTVAGLDWRAVERGKEGRLLRRLSHQQALALCYSQRTRPAWDEQAECLAFTYASDEGPRRVYMWNRRTLLRYIQRLEFYGLAGMRVGPAGNEDERLWDELLSQACAARYVS